MNMFNFKSTLTTIILTVQLAGCSLDPTMVLTSSDITKKWRTQPAQNTGSSVKMLSWQQFIVDDNLRHLVGTALANNRDLRKALLNVEAMRAQYRIERSALLPSMQANADLTMEKTPGDLNQNENSSLSDTAQVNLGMASYELDLFGRLRSLTRAASEEYLSSAESTHSARTTLVSEVIRTYLIRDRSLRRLELAEKTVQTRKESESLIKGRFRAGTSSELDYQEALRLTDHARADVQSICRELAISEHKLQKLAGIDNIHHYLPGHPTKSQLILQTLKPGMPSELLENRPDIKAAERQIRSRNASIGAARAAFFPSISLTGNYGTSSAELTGLFNGGQTTWTFRPSINFPLFQGGRNMATLDAANLRKDSAIANYESVLQTAFQEVSDSLSNLDTLNKELELRKNQLISSQRAVELADARYRAGVDDYLRLMDAQRSYYSAQTAYINLTTLQQENLVTLFRSLGGSWSLEAI
ncbi:efflux transporter outer membrane subunit [Salmonella enterica]|nr:efflux transporter outer membrane subunit [Salmonella enterica]